MHAGAHDPVGQRVTHVGPRPIVLVDFAIGAHDSDRCAPHLPPMLPGNGGQRDRRLARINEYRGIARRVVALEDCIQRQDTLGCARRRGGLDGPTSHAAPGKIKNTAASEPIEHYLRRYPGGQFAELAQLRLDQILAKLGEKKIEVVSAPDNPYSKGSARANTAYRVGDTYTYRVFDLFNKLELQTSTTTVTAISENEVIFNNGTLVTDLLGNLLRSRREIFSTTARQYYVAEYSVGKKWSTRYIGTGIEQNKLSYEYEFKVLTRERKTVPAGTFDAFKVEGAGFSSSGAVHRWDYWIAPDRVKRPIAIEQVSRNRGTMQNREGTELVSYREER